MIFVSGSIAVDTIINTFGTFESNKSPNGFNISLYSEQLDKKNWWTGQNISYWLGILGLMDQTKFVWSIGKDFVFDPNLQKYINYEFVQKDSEKNTAWAYIIHDENHSQINVFYPGAMSSWVREIPKFDYKIWIVSPNDKNAMKFYLKKLKEFNVETIIFDPWQSLGIWSKEDILEIYQYSNFLTCNEYEFADICKKIWTDEIGILDYFSQVVVTLGSKWARYISANQKFEIPANKVESVIDSSGAGEAFRSGLLYGLYNGLDIQSSMQKWSEMWARCVGHFGSIWYL